jgi:hypothetical protein
VIRIVIEQRIQIPAPVSGKTGDGIRTREDQVPQLLRRADAARVTAPHPHDHHRVFAGHHHCWHRRVNGRLDRVILAEDRHVRSQEIR